MCNVDRRLDLCGLARPSRVGPKPVRTLETVQQIAVVDDDVLDRFGVDVIPGVCQSAGRLPAGFRG